ncbi:MAG: trans-2-enoyl-CoA reductase family protein [Opitutales bacterium]|nr:trans-2-enoyl-CoA reductase family protein [Opitutales bacterium]
MKIQPKVRGFICITAHPEGCAANVHRQIEWVRLQELLPKPPKTVLILGASTGYGLASRIVSVCGAKADTLGVFYERPSVNGKPASPGWYNTVALEVVALRTGRKFYSINGDAFSSDIKSKVVRALREKLSPVDLVVYSLAAPRRTDASGVTYQSVLKPTKQVFTSKTVNTDKGEVFETTLEAATDEEVLQTVKVMGGEDWEAWIRLLAKEGLLVPKATTVAYSYIGPEITWPIYQFGTIGRAKAHLMETAQRLHSFLSETLQGRALISVNKAVVTQASSAIPVVPLYNSILRKILQEKGLEEDCMQQIYRLFSGLFGGKEDWVRESETCVRLDDRELNPSVQEEVKRIWQQINTENLRTLSDFDGYQKKFLQLFGFECEGVNYEADVNLDRPMRHLLP